MTKAHEQMSKAVAIAARKVEKKRRKQVQKSTGGSLQKRKRKR
jgi:hypothetical protein